MTSDGEEVTTLPSFLGVSASVRCPCGGSVMVSVKPPGRAVCACGMTWLWQAEGPTRGRIMALAPGHPMLGAFRDP